MRNSTAARAGVPAPFDDLEPLRLYLDLLLEVVNDPTPQTTTAYVTYDRDIFTPVAGTSLDVWHRDEIRTCILYDGVKAYAELAQVSDVDSEEFSRVYGKNFVSSEITFSVYNDNGTLRSTLHSEPAIASEAAKAHIKSGASLRNSARCVVNSLAERIATTGAFPERCVSDAYRLLDETLVSLVGDDESALTFARKRMRFELLNAWVEETQWQFSTHTGNPEEVLRNVSTGWKIFGAPYGAPWIAKLAGRTRLRTHF